MPVAPVNGIEIFYDTHGDRSDTPMVRVCGISVQMIWWWDNFVERLADRGSWLVAPPWLNAKRPPMGICS